MAYGRCFACDRKLGKNPAVVTCSDEQDVFVGSECYKDILAAGKDGWVPPSGGPRLFTLKNDPKRTAPIDQQELASRYASARKTEWPFIGESAHGR